MHSEPKLPGEATVLEETSRVRIPQDLGRRMAAIRLVVFDFDGVFTDNTVYVMQDGSEAVRCFRGDGLGVTKLQQAGMHVVILSSETNPVVSVRCRKLGIRCVQGCADKRQALQALLKELAVSPGNVAYVGNDVNDLSCLTWVGLPIVVQDAHPDVMAHAIYRTQARGGQGAVREVADLLTRVRDGESSTD